MMMYHEGFEIQELVIMKDEIIFMVNYEYHKIKYVENKCIIYLIQSYIDKNLICI